MNKNNILLLIIIILIVALIIYGYFIFFKLNTDGFQNAEVQRRIDRNMESSRHQCRFYPWGPTLESCKNNCMNKQGVGLWDETGAECSEEVCEEICGLCNYEPACQWIASWSSLEKEKMLKINESDTILSKLIPRQLHISAVSYPDIGYQHTTKSKIKLNWQNYGDYDALMIHYYNMKEGENMIKVETITDESSIQGQEEHELGNLDSNTKYSIIIYSINEYGVSKGSNILLVDT